MEPHEALITWAIEQGVRLDGIAPERIPGRGIGLVATRAIEPEEIILKVPTSCLRSVDTVPKPIARRLPKSLTIHGLLAADLAEDRSSKYSVWNAVCPKPEDFISMPLLWPAELRAFLPPTALDLLSKQDTKFQHDWVTVSAAFPQLSEDSYRHAWLLVNTRTFYYVNGRLKKRPKEDHMCFQPVADLFNHGDEGCNVAFNFEGFSIKALRAYSQGEEVKICYGRHSGDFLLVEYGFVMDENMWDEVLFDDVLLPRLNQKQKERLEEAGFLGKYVLDRNTVCHRTQVAARLLCCSVREWKRFVDGIDDGERSQGEVDLLILELLRELKENAEGTISKVEASNIGEEQQREVLIKRWRQIQNLVDMGIVRFEKSSN
ncbi:hypothetical protein AAE478_008300 [Parahypoxylon ruwenzoriense]